MKNLINQVSKKQKFKTLKQKKVDFAEKCNFKAVFEKKQARTYTASSACFGSSAPRNIFTSV